MNKTVLQVPINISLKNTAEEVASEQGFSSLQEVVRVFLARFAAKKVELTWQEPIYLSEASEKKYIAFTEDFKKGKNSNEVGSVKELLEVLNEDKIS